MGELSANTLRARREFSQHAPKRLARDPHDHRILGRSRADPALGLSVERALANESAGADPALAFRLASVREQCNRARMNEIAEVRGLAGEEERIAGLQAPLFRGESDELHRLARKQAEWASAREPSDIVVQRHSDRPPAAALAISLYPPASVTSSWASAGLCSIFWRSR
jgi:hypothetical protein